MECGHQSFRTSLPSHFRPIASVWPTWQSREQQGPGTGGRAESGFPPQLWLFSGISQAHSDSHALRPFSLKNTPAPRIMVASVAPSVWFYSRYKCSFQLNTSKETEEASGSLDQNSLQSQGYLFVSHFESVPFLFLILSFPMAVSRISFSMATCSFWASHSHRQHFPQFSGCRNILMHASVGVLCDQGWEGLIFFM